MNKYISNCLFVLLLLFSLILTTYSTNNFSDKNHKTSTSINNLNLENIGGTVISTSYQNSGDKWPIWQLPLINNEYDSKKLLTSISTCTNCNIKCNSGKYCGCNDITNKDCLNCSPECLDCPIGHYCVGGIKPAFPCPLGKYSISLSSKIWYFFLLL
jgi:hypothetical protein